MRARVDVAVNRLFFQARLVASALLIDQRKIRGSKEQCESASSLNIQGEIYAKVILYRSADDFDERGVVSLFRPTQAQRDDTHRSLPVPMRQLIVDLKAEFPDFTLREIAGISAYSALNACIGSRRDARHAGTVHANAATASSVAATAAKTAGSSGLIS